MQFACCIDMTYAAGLVVFLHSLRQNSQLPEDSPFTVIMAEPLTDDVKKALSGIGYPLDFVPLTDICEPITEFKVKDRLNVAIQCLSVFLLPYPKVCKFDVDMICTGPIDDVLKWEHFSIVPVKGTKRQHFNDGLYVCRPSQTVFNALMETGREILGGGKKTWWADQEILNAHFPVGHPDRKNQHWKYNLPLKVVDIHQRRDGGGDMGAARIIHFAGINVWGRCWPPKIPTDNTLGMWAKKWWRHWQAVMGPKRNKREGWDG